MKHKSLKDSKKLEEKKTRSWFKPKGRAKSPLTGARHLSINGSYLIYPILGKGHYLISVIFDKPRICFIQCLSDRSSFNREIITKLVPNSDMEFVQNFTPPDFQAKNFTPSISPNLNSFSKKKHKK